MFTNLHKTLCLVFIICTLSSCKKVVAQEKIKPIRNIYKTITNQIKTCKTSEDSCDLYLATWELNKNGNSWRAVGTHNQKIDFWYKEIDPETMTYHPLKIIVNTSTSRYNIYEEWLFDETGGLLFYFIKDEMEETENRFYFNKKTLIHTISKPKKSTLQLDVILTRKDKIITAFNTFVN